MRYGHLIIGFVVATLTTGCASFKKSIENRVTISEECRQTLATPPTNFNAASNIASVSIGYVGHCDVTHTESFLSMCSLAQIRTKYGFSTARDPISTRPVFKEATRRISTLTGRLHKPQSPQSDLDKATVSFYDAIDDINDALGRPDRQAIRASVDKLKTAVGELVVKLVNAKAPPDVQAASQEAGKAMDLLAASLVSVTDLDAFDQAVFNLCNALIRLVADLPRLDTQYHALLDSVKEPNFATRTASMTAAMKAAVATPDNLKSDVENVRHAHEATRQAARNLNASLSQQAAIELAAWDSNLRIQLEELEQLLSGDFSLVFNAGIRDEVLTHVARRSLELLHGALKPADAVINRLDDKAYGAVSVGYLAFGPDLQEAVNNAFNQVAEVYQNRLRQGQADTSSKAVEPFFLELKRAACDNLTQGTQFSMLSELVDTMLILQTKLKLPNDKPTTPLLTVNNASEQATIFPPATGAAGSLPLAKARFILSGTAAADAVSQPSLAEAAQSVEPAQPPVTPLSVYSANQWMARQQLLTKKITDTVTAPRTDGSPKPTPFEDIETVDEGLVKQIADAATAMAIDDAARLNPSLLKQHPVGVSPQIQNSVNVVTAAAAVSQASAVLKLNLSISNVNTFSPTNSNTVAPVITVSAPGSTVSAVASPCTAIDFESIGISCFNHGGNMVLAFNSQHFRSDSCMPDDLAPALTAAGNMLKSYRARSGIGYRATVDGYASLPTARLAHCPGTAAGQARVCTYVNVLHQTVPIVGCDGKHTDRNTVLSARRAGVAANALEGVADGAVVVDGLRALGTETAGMREAGAPASIDQTVVIRLTPVGKP